MLHVEWEFKLQLFFYSIQELHRTKSAEEVLHKYNSNTSTRKDGFTSKSSPQLTSCKTVIQRTNGSLGDNAVLCKKKKQSAFFELVTHGPNSDHEKKITTKKVAKQNSRDECPVQESATRHSNCLPVHGVDPLMTSPKLARRNAIRREKERLYQSKPAWMTISHKPWRKRCSAANITQSSPLQTPKKQYHFKTRNEYQTRRTSIQRRLSKSKKRTMEDRYNHVIQSYCVDDDVSNCLFLRLQGLNRCHSFCNLSGVQDCEAEPMPTPPQGMKWVVYGFVWTSLCGYLWCTPPAVLVAVKLHLNCIISVPDTWWNGASLRKLSVRKCNHANINLHAWLHVQMMF